MKKNRMLRLPFLVPMVVILLVGIGVIVFYGWLALKESWNGKTAGADTTQLLPHQTTIRQQTFYADGKRLLTNNYELVQEHQATTTPNTNSD